jgi:sugar lactone lactonase YvrE
MIGLTGPADGSAYFSNFSFRADDSLSFPPVAPAEQPLGLITDWEISQVFKANETDLESTPAAQGLDTVQWRKVKSLASGVVDISRFYGRKGADADCIFARTIIECSKDETKQFAFGYSDAITIFLNGKILFSANSAYRQRDASFLGVVGLNDYVYLPLKKGTNELLLNVVEMSGGWGFIFQDANAVFESPTLTKVWEIQRKLKYPESVAYDSKRDVLYVSNYFNNGNEFISKITTSGKTEKLIWISGLRQPTGLSIVDNKYLYAVERRSLSKIDIDSAKVVASYPIPGAAFPNDITADEAGHLYVTDSQKNSIMILSDGKFISFLEGGQLSGINGILYDNGKLLVGVTGDASIKQIDVMSKEITTLARLESGSVMDGLRKDGSGNYLFSDYNGRVFRLYRNGKVELLLNTKAPQRFCADFEYIPERHLLIIPSLFDNRIVTYRISEK